jgi:DNA-binding NtrC family response regulator
VQLFADRFVITSTHDGAHRAIDLATGALVTVLTSSAGGASDEMRWSVRCDRFFRLRHRCIARLVDYGAVGPSTRFEAWRCGDLWRGGSRIAATTLAQARVFLHASGCVDGELSPANLCTDGGRPVLLPRSATGYDGTPAGPQAILDDLSCCGVTTIERPSVDAIAEILATATGPSPIAIMLGAVDGAGRSVAVQQLARVARIRGFVPLTLEAQRLDPAEAVEALEGRTLCLFDRQGSNRAWLWLLDRILNTERPHVLISIGAHVLSGAARLRLERVSAASMVRSVTPGFESAALRKAVERAARRSEGLPARFAELLWGPPVIGRDARRRWGHQAAERPPVYAEGLSAAPPLRMWPAPSDVAAHRKRLADALDLLARGRHAPAERSLRAVVGSLARRHDWHHAVRGELALAGALLRRGKARDARQVLVDARAFASQAGNDPLFLEIGVLAGHARLDEGRLDEAETMLRATLAAARAGDAPAATGLAGTALARCLFWRGHFGEADTVLDTAGPGDDEQMLAHELLRARVALGRGDIGAAMSHASAAGDRADRQGSPAATARALYAAALAHLAAGDLQAVNRDVDRCVRASRAAHDPLRALKARLLAAEAQRRAGGSASADRLAHMVARAGRVDLPVTIRARIALLSDLCRGVDQAVRKQVASTGLHALVLFAPIEAYQRVTSAYDTAIDILNLCQSGEDEAAVLAEICRRVRERLHAIGIAIFVRDGEALVQIAADGNRIEPPIASRTIDARQAIPPAQVNERIESAVPVRYAGETLGALAARWTVAAPRDPARAEMILTMTATAAATAVSAVVARRRAAAGTGIAEILGSSRGIADVREAIERAAAAPFPVMVEGESGSGKDLVARAVHRRSVRRDRAFSALNCAALPDDLVDAELFGHSRGAFTGAVAERAGVFEESHLGTLFLDEVGELSPRAQAKLLRTLQDGEVRRVGENTSRRVDIRLVAATNRDLRQEVAAGRFRLDLMYRLDVIRILVPPLRDRRDDIPLLAEHFWQAAAARVGSRAMLSPQSLAALARHDWPGNVRELQNVLAALAVRAPRRGLVPATALPPAFGAPALPSSCRLGDARRSFEERFIRAALARTGGHRGRAAEELGLSRQGLAKLIARLQIA